MQMMVLQTSELEILRSNNNGLYHAKYNCYVYKICQNELNI